MRSLETHRHTLLSVTTLMLEVLQVRVEKPGMSAQRPDLERVQDIVLVGQAVVNRWFTASSSLQHVQFRLPSPLGQLVPSTATVADQSRRGHKPHLTGGGLCVDLWREQRQEVLQVHDPRRKHLQKHSFDRHSKASLCGTKRRSCPLWAWAGTARQACLKTLRTPLRCRRAGRPAGCAADWACGEGCRWAEPNLGSACVPGVEA